MIRTHRKPPFISNDATNGAPQYNAPQNVERLTSRLDFTGSLLQKSLNKREECGSVRVNSIPIVSCARPMLSILVRTYLKLGRKKCARREERTRRVERSDAKGSTSTRDGGGREIVVKVVALSRRKFVRVRQKAEYAHWPVVFSLCFQNRV